MTPVTTCINSGKHIEGWETCFELDEEQGDLLATCGMCNNRVRIKDICTQGNQIGFHWPEHDA